MWGSSVGRVGFGWAVCILKLFCPHGHSQPFAVGNEKCSEGGRNHIAKPRGDVWREDLGIMPWGEVSRVVLQAVPGALLFYPYSRVCKSGCDPKWKTQGLTTHFPAQNKRWRKSQGVQGVLPARLSPCREIGGLCCHGVRVW